MSLDDFNLKDKVALVTGAATGLGQSMAAGLAEAGADVFGVGHSTSMETTRELVQESGQEFEHLMCDIREEGIEEKRNFRESMPDYLKRNIDGVFEDEVEYLTFIGRGVPVESDCRGIR